MRRLAIFVVRRRWWVIGIALIALPAAAAYGANVHDALASGGFFDPGAESTLTRAAIVKEFPRSAQSDFAIVVTAKNGKDVNDPAVAAAGTALTAQLGRERGVLTSSSYWTLNRVAQLHSRDSRQALIFATLHKSTFDRVIAPILRPNHRLSLRLPNLRRMSEDGFP